jgi:GNAT superfamily N-acetyltransferase
VPRISVQRAISADDLELAVSIWEAANRSRRRPAGPVRAGRIRTKIFSGDLVLLARYGDRPAGMLLAEEFVDVAPDPSCRHIAMVFVDPAVWGSGVGGRLLRELQGMQWPRLSVWTRADNRRARRLYGSVGFADPGDRAFLQDGAPILHLIWQRPAD